MNILLLLFIYLHITCFRIYMFFLRCINVQLDGKTARWEECACYYLLQGEGGRDA